MKKNILIPIYHPRDYLFYKKISENIKLNNFIFLFFYDFGKINSSNIINFFNYNLKTKTKIKIKKKKLIHEQLTFKKNIPILNKKYSLYFSKNLEILKKFKIDIVIQELGGFVCHLSLFDAAKKLRINHYFIEPSPLKKNCFFLKNSMKQECAIILNSKSITKRKINEYLNSLKDDKYLAINNKDLHLIKKNMFYQIFSIITFKVLIKKIKDVIFYKHNEFSNLRLHLSDYINRTCNSLINFFFKKKNIEDIEGFVYYPLHVPLDFALTHRAPEKLNQLKNLIKIFPNAYQLTLKEHPLIYSKYNYFLVKKIMKKNKIKIDFFDKNLSSLQIAHKAKCVLTINSKSGLEFLCKGKPTFSLIKNYYTKKGLAIYIKNKLLFEKYLNNVSQYIPNKDKLNNLLNDIFKRAIFFDLYNLENLNESIRSFKLLISDKNKICKKF